MLTAAVVVAVQVPEDMQDKEFAAILQEEPMQPLALVPLTEEEQVRLAPPTCRATHPATHGRARTHTATGVLMHTVHKYRRVKPFCLNPRRIDEPLPLYGIKTRVLIRTV